jgi:hypothetical protein
MIHAQTYDRYLGQFNSLKGIVAKSQGRILQDDPDIFFVENSNFLVKSYLTSLCSYLEAFLKDIAFEQVNRIKAQISQANVPHNIVMWSLDNDVKDKDLAYRQFDLPLSKKDIDDELSGNPFRTVKLFRYIGIDLDANDEFRRNRELVHAVVAKRNNIIHHNDAATDISLGDLLAHIDVFIEYSKTIQIIATIACGK